MSEFNLEEYLQKLQQATNIDDCPKVPIPEIGKDQNYVFVSYSHKDYKEVYYDLAHLYCQGVRFWYDKGLAAGEDWEKEVRENIQSPRCGGVIFYLSTNMFSSDSIFKEIEFTSAKKKHNIILQKNYFCVNLQNSNISDMLFEVQEIQRKEGKSRLDTKKLNVLTSTFSDNDTYIKFNSSYHIDELIEQIQHKFDVTSVKSEDTKGALALDKIKDPRLAFFAVSERETDAVPLFKFLYADFKATKMIRPWFLLIIGIVIGIITVLTATYFVFAIPDVPLLPQIKNIYKIPMVVLSCILVPWLTAKSFWLFYFTPFGRYRGRGFLGNLVNCVAYILTTIFMVLIGVVVSKIVFYLSSLLLEYLINLLA